MAGSNHQPVQRRKQHEQTGDRHEDPDGVEPKAERPEPQQGTRPGGHGETQVRVDSEGVLHAALQPVEHEEHGVVEIGPGADRLLPAETEHGVHDQQARHGRRQEATDDDGARP